MDLIEELATFSQDPEGFVLWAFPWGEEGTELAQAWPEDWQLALLRRVRDGLSIDKAVLEAVASGHGVGKSALVSWLILWAFSTRENTLGVVTANTLAQLRTKTWVQLSKWFRLFLANELFELQATVLRSRDPDHRDTWRIDQVTWSEENTEAFAGLHNQGSRILIVFDEASGIVPKIWEVTSGALTDANTEILWFAFGNPTQNSGEFYNCFHNPKSPWSTTRVDSRSVRITNHKQLNDWIANYGIDSDYCRVRILGLFPNHSSQEFISPALVKSAQSRDLTSSSWDALVLGVDVARQGEDDSVLYFRKGLDARTIRPMRVRIPNLMSLAGTVMQQAALHRPAAIFVDEGGVGAGLVDRLRQLGLIVQGIQFGSSADLPPKEGEGRYRNKRSEMYGSVRRWLTGGGCLPDDPDLAAELSAPFFALNDADEIVLERKRDIRKRLGSSTDAADALALTFAYPVVPALTAFGGPDHSPTILRDYNPFELNEVA